MVKFPEFLGRPPYRGSGGTATQIFNLGTRCRSVVIFMLRATARLGKDIPVHYQQGARWTPEQAWRLWIKNNILFLPRIEPPFPCCPLQLSIISVYRNADNDNHLITYASANGIGRLLTGHRGPEGYTTVTRLGGSLHYRHDCHLWNFILRPRYNAVDCYRVFLLSANYGFSANFNFNLVLSLPSSTTIIISINNTLLFLCRYTIRILFNTFALGVHVVTIITCKQSETCL
jgi:hypothetical protein